jgi:hypothetical protein
MIFFYTIALHYVLEEKKSIRTKLKLQFIGFTCESNASWKNIP